MALVVAGSGSPRLGKQQDDYLPASCYASFQHGGNHLLGFEGGGFKYLSVPAVLSKTVDEAKLCFLDHQMEAWDSMSEMCCLREAGHVHAHVHHGDITEDILLEQCMEGAGCTLPIPWDMGSPRTPLLCSGDEHDSDHEHQEGCGHDQIAHGDHFDWLVPLKDGSYVLSHSQATANGGSQFIEHGRLVKVGESLGQLKRRPKQLIALFTYEGPNSKGFGNVPATTEIIETDMVTVVKPPSSASMPLSAARQAVVQEEMVMLTIPRGFKGQGTTKTMFDVMGICCPSEVPLVKKILEPLPGVEEVHVNATSKTVTVLHDSTIVADVQLVKILNEARLDASIHQRGKRRIARKWPSPWTIGSGILLLISFLHYAWSPLKWVALGSVALGVPPILIRSLVALRRRVLDINALMLIAVGGAIGLGDYVEAGSIAFLFTLADWLESRSSDKARDAISSVADLAPQTAVLMDGQRVNVEDVSLGTLLAVKAGELIPIDGEVVSGKSSVDESNVTGESKPVEKTLGAFVWAGTMNLSGYISVKTTALAEDSAVSRMVRLVEESQNQHSHTEQLVQKVAKYYTPFVVVSAALIALIPLAAGSHHMKHWIYLALVLLVVACPCALVISTPVTTTCGIAQAARAGLVVRGGSYLEALGKCKVLAMDKTGTLTEGHFRVLDVHSLDSATSVQQILYWVACVESKSSHPLAPALVAYARLHGVEPSGDISDFEIIPGLGVSAVVEGVKVQIGNARLAANFMGFEDTNSEIVQKWSSLGATLGWVGVNEQPVGVFGVADTVREDAIEAVASLKKLGMRIVMLTGDSAAAASTVHNQVGDIEIHAELLPENKVTLVKELKTTGVTAMVGDGINDAPALALADIGIAMGVAGSAVAMETADVALMTNDLRKLSVAIKLGRNVRWKIIQNVSLSFVTKITIIVLAAAGHPSLWAAVLADVGTCLVVIFNSMRLLNRKKGVVLPKFESKKRHGHNHVAHDHKHNVHHDLHELDKSCNDDHHHQELGKIRFNHLNHLEEVGDFEDSHDHHHDAHIGNTGKDCRVHSLDLDKTCEHDHHVPRNDQDHGPGVKGHCGPLDEHMHGDKERQEPKVMSDQTFTSQSQIVRGWSKFQKKVASISGITSKCRKSCAKEGFASNCCSDRRAVPENNCCRSSNKDTRSGPKPSQVFRSSSGSTPSSKCCTKSGGDMSIPLGNSSCCMGTEQGSKSCSKRLIKTRVSQVTVSGRQCCSGQDSEKKPCSSLHKNLKASPDGLPYPGKEKDVCCPILDVNSNAAAGTHCHSGQDFEKRQDYEKICYSNSEMKMKTGHGKQHCSGQVKEKTCCSTSFREFEAPSGTKCSSGADEGKCCSNTDDKLKAGSDIQCDVEKGCCSNLVKNIQGASGRQRSSTPAVEKNCCSIEDDKLRLVSASRCCSEQELEKKCCSTSDSNCKAASGKQCSNLEDELEAAFDSQCCSGQDVRENCCSDSDEKLEGVSGELNGDLTTSHHHGQHHCHRSSALPHKESCLDESNSTHHSCPDKETSGRPCQNDPSNARANCCMKEKSHRLSDKESCCSTVDCSQGGSHDLTRRHGKAATAESFGSCGMSVCKAGDHSKCSMEALVHSPLRDLSSFTRPVSPI